MERILQFNNRSQPLVRGLQTGSRKGEKQYTDNNTPETRWFTNNTHKGTLRLMLEYFTPEDNELEDNNYHKHVRAITTRPINTPDDSAFAREEIRRVIEGMDNKKAPGEDGITAEIHKETFKILPKA
jgi:hypothetical protein